MKITSFSAREMNMLNRLEFEGKEIYTSNDIISFSSNIDEAKYLIKKLLEKKRLKSIIKNVYFFAPMKAPKGRWMPNEYLVAQALARGVNYYIGYSSVFNLYGYTEQVSQTVHIINAKYSEKKVILGVKYELIKVLPDRLYGLEEREINNEKIIFPRKERAIIDVFEFYSIKQAYNILQSNLNSLDFSVLVDYVSIYPVQIIRRRIGYFLENLYGNKRLLNKINVGETGYSKLYDIESRKGKIVKKWRVIVNG